MLDTKTRDEILLEEKIAKIDDINFDKIYSIDDFAEKQIENFDEVNLSQNNISESANYQKENEFEFEVGSNVFLDNFAWGKEDETEQKVNKKLKVNNKLLIFTFTSIAALLSILLIYNVFVINSLTYRFQNAQNMHVQSAFAVVNNYEEENNYIALENSSKIEIENNVLSQNLYNNNKPTSGVNSDENEFKQTNLFDQIVSKISALFGGKL